jgi:hypothetical protein
MLGHTLSGAQFTQFTYVLSVIPSAINSLLIGQFHGCCIAQHGLNLCVYHHCAF